MSARQTAIDAYKREFGSDPTHLASAPGRVNLIGEHTDYQAGFVMPLALEQRAWIAFTPHPESTIFGYAADLDSRAKLDLTALTHRPRQWTEHVLGIADQLQSGGYVTGGWSGAIASDVPRGSGLSSSAALQLAVTGAFSVAGPFPWDGVAMAQLAQRAENEWVGSQCGIMDQLASATATAGAALLIDCRSLETTPVSLPDSVSVVVMDTSTRRGLLDTEYNERRASCEQAAKTLGVDALRDATMDMLESGRELLDDIRYRRARHVISENERVLAAFEQRADPKEFGKLMNESHFSMRDDFNASGPELDTVTEIARTIDGCFGARLTGAGFAGAAVALVQSELVGSFIATASDRFAEATGLTPTITACQPSHGASTEEYRP